MPIFGPTPAPPPVTRQRLKEIAALARRKGREASGEFLVEGVRSVEAAVGAGAPLADVLVAPGAAADPRVAAVLERAGHRGAPVHYVPARDLDRVGDARTSQGLLAVARSVVRDALPEGTEGPVLLLDGVQDPGNVGALVRTAAWFGVEAVVADHKTADFEGPKAVRASMGGLWDVALVRVPDLVPVLDELDRGGYAVWGAHLGGTSASRWAPGRRSALVLGSEAHGLSEAVADRLRAASAGDPFVFIPGAERGRPAGVESLNVAVAAGVLLGRWLG